MEDDACREDVTNGVTLGGHIADVDDFWCNEARSTASDEKILFFFGVSGESEVADGGFPLFVLLEHDVLWLEVTVDDPVFGQMCQSAEDTLDNSLSVVMFDFSATLT